MFLLVDRKQIEKVEDQISRDFSSVLHTAYPFNLEYSKPKQIKFSTYRVSTDVVQLGSKYYPAHVFCGVQELDVGKAFLLDSKYESLGGAVAIIDGRIVFGIKSKTATANNLKEAVKPLYFDINVSNGTYEVVDEKAEREFSAAQKM